MGSAPRICLVIPCYNEAQRLPKERFLEALEQDPGLSLCLVNDGSSDGTSALISGMAQQKPERITVMELGQNSGKAEAVRQGMLKMAAESEADFIGYFDADLATPLAEARYMLDRMPKTSKAVMLFGSRVKLLGTTNIHRLWYRHYFGRVFATVVSNMLGLAVYDTQCGAKLFKREAVQALFEAPFVTKWLFDVELFFRCTAQYGKEEASHRMLEMNLREWQEIGGSKLGFGFMLKVPFQLLRIRRVYRSR